MTGTPDRFTTLEWICLPRNTVASVLSISVYVGAQIVLEGWGGVSEIQIVAILLSTWILFEAYRLGRRYGTMLHGYVLVLATFAFIYPVSAIAHFSYLEGFERGFYDLARSGSAPDLTLIYLMYFQVIVAFSALYLGLNPMGINARTRRLDLQVRFPVLLVGTFFTALGVVGTMKLFGGESSFIDNYLSVDRTREIGGGLAKFVFMSHWLSWGFTFLATYLITTLFKDSRYGSSLMILMFSLMIILNILWTGGRASVIVSLLPAFMLFEKIDIRFPRSTIAFVGILALAYIVVATVIRSESKSPIGGMNMLLNVLDWHSGRFSMIGLGYEIVSVRGLAWGSTLSSGLISAMNAPLDLVRISSVLTPPQSIPSVIGEHLHGNPSITGIVPGTICEFYINFGLAGVASGYYILGRLVRFCVGVMGNTRSVGLFSVAAYIVVLACTTIIPGTASGWVYYLVTLGVPPITLYLAESVAWSI